MNETNKLINQLRLHRDSDVSVSAPGTGRWMFAGIFLGTAITVGVLGLWWLLATRVDGVLIQVAVATPVTSVPGSTDSAVLNASGYIVARRQATVSAKITARVMEVFIDEGQHVEAGQVIATLDDTNIKATHVYTRAQLEQAVASRRAAHNALANEEPLFARMREQLDRGVSSMQDFDTAKARYEAAKSSLDVATRTVAVAEASLAMVERNMDDTIVRAPFAGIVTAKTAQPGEMVSPNSAGGGFTRTGIGTIVDMNSLEVDVDVSESFINRIAPGQRVSVRLNAYPDWVIAGHVITVVPTADRAKATVKVRIALEESDARILPDMGARVSFLHADALPASSEPITNAGVVIPRSAVIANGTTGTVFVVHDTTVQQREVILGSETQSGWLVPEGIPAGTHLAASALDQLYDGARIRVEASP